MDFVLKQKGEAMDDLISRQWLMECVNERWIKFDTEKDENRFIHLVRDIAPSAQPEQAIKDCRNCKYGSYNDHLNNYFCYYSGDCNDWDKWEPSAQPDFDTITKIDKAHDDGYEQGYLQGKADYERKTGKWIPQDYNQRHGNISTTVYYYPKCSVCGCSGDYTDAFCKSCGARMEGE